MLAKVNRCHIVHHSLVCMVPQSADPSPPLKVPPTGMQVKDLHHGAVEDGGLVCVLFTSGRGGTRKQYGKKASRSQSVALGNDLLGILKFL